MFTDFARVLRPITARLPGLLGMAMVVLLLPLVSAQETTEAKLRTGRALQKSLEQRRALNVQATPLREVLSDLREQTEICIVADRRLDPTARLTLNTGLTTTTDLLEQVAAALPGAAVSVNRSFVYIGPTQTAERLRTLCEQQRDVALKSRQHLEADAYALLSSAQSVAWDDVRNPRDILQELAEATGVTITNLSELPHDLWHAGRLARMPFAESATLLLAQFDLTYRLDATNATCEVVALPDVVVMKQRHAVPRQQRDQVQTLLTRILPDVDMTWTRSAVVAQATYEQHQQIEQLLAGKPVTGTTIPADSLKTRVFTLSLPENITWKSLIGQLQASNVAIQVEGDLGVLLNQKVTAQLKRLPGKEFFPLLFADLPVTVAVEDDEVVLRVTGTE